MQRFGSKLIAYKWPGCEMTQPFTDEYWECMIRQYSATIYHPVGTCKMGPYWDQTAVVDPELRVYGVRGLRVIDASISEYTTFTGFFLLHPLALNGEMWHFAINVDHNSRSLASF